MNHFDGGKQSQALEMLFVCVVGYFVLVTLIYWVLTDWQSSYSFSAVFLPWTTDTHVIYRVYSFVSFVVPLLGFILYFARQSAAALYGEARFSSAWEVWRAGLFSNHGIVLGKFDGFIKRFVVNGRRDCESVLVVEPTGIGKTSGILKPTLAHYPGSVVITDVAGDIERDTGGWRAKLGDVFIFRCDGRPSHRINVLDYIREGDNRLMDAMNLAHIYYPATPNNKDNFFVGAARSLFAHLLVLICELNEITERHTRENQSIQVIPRTMGGIWRLVNPMAYYVDERSGVELPTSLDAFDPQRELMSSLFRTFPEIADTTKRFITRFYGTAKRQRDGVLETLNQVLDLWADPHLDRVTSASDLDLRAIRRKPTTIYLQLNSDEYTRFAPLIKAIFDTTFVNMCATIPDLKKEPFSVLFALDELANLGPLPRLSERTTQLRKHRGHILALIQSLNQLSNVYGDKEAGVLLSSFKQQVFSTSMDPETARFIAGKGFTMTSQSESTSSARFTSRLDERSSKGTASEKLIKDYETYVMKKDRLLIFSESMFPIRAKTIRSHKSKRYTSMWGYSTKNRVVPPAVPAVSHDAFNQLSLFVIVNKKGEFRAVHTPIEKQLINHEINGALNELS